MDFYILSKSLVYLFLSVSHPTTLVFDEPVEYVSAGREGDFSIHRANNQKILVIRPIKEIADTDMVVLTKDQHYQFRVLNSSFDKGRDHSFVYIHDGIPNKAYVLKYEDQNIRILEGETSSLVQNKSKDKVFVNEKIVEREANFSKGIPFILNNKRIFN